MDDDDDDGGGTCTVPIPMLVCDRHAMAKIMYPEWTIPLHPTSERESQLLAGSHHPDPKMAPCLYTTNFSVDESLSPDPV